MFKLENGSNLVYLVATALFAAVASSLITYKLTSDDKKFAVVNLNRVVSVSRDIAALRSVRETQIADLKKMTDSANEKIKTVSKEEDKKKLTQEYMEEIQAKKADYDKTYAAALQASDQKLTAVINSVAEKEGLDVVLNKSSIISGGIDITDSVIDMVK